MNGDGNCGNVYSQYILDLLVKSEAVVDLFGIPILELYDKVDPLGGLYRAHTEKTSYVNYSDASKLNVISDKVGSRSHQ